MRKLFWIKGDSITNGMPSPLGQALLMSPIPLVVIVAAVGRYLFWR